MANGRGLTPLGRPGGVPPIIVEPTAADLTLARIDHPQAGPCVMLTLAIPNVPVIVRVPIPVLSWAKLTSDVGVGEPAE